MLELNRIKSNDIRIFSPMLYQLSYKNMFLSLYKLYKNFNISILYDTFLFTILSSFELFMLFIFVFILLIIFLNFINNFFSKEKKINFIKFIFKRILFSFFIFFLFNSPNLLFCIEFKPLNKKESLILGSSILFTGIAGIYIYKALKKNNNDNGNNEDSIIALKPINDLKPINELSRLKKEIDDFNTSNALVIPGLTPKDSIYFSILQKNNENICNSVILFNSKRDDIKEQEMSNFLNFMEIRNYHYTNPVIFQPIFFKDQLNHVTTVDEYYSTEDLKKLYENRSANNKNYMIDQENLYQLDKLLNYKIYINYLKDNLYNRSYNTLHKFVLIDYYSIYKNQYVLNNNIKTCYLNYMDICLLYNDRFQSFNYYYPKFRYLNTSVNYQEYFNFWVNMHKNVINYERNTFSSYWDYKHLFEIAVNRYINNCIVLRNSIQIYYESLSFTRYVHYESARMRILQQYSENFNFENLQKLGIDFTSLINQLKNPLLTIENSEVTQLSLKLILFKLKLIGVKVSCIFFYPPLFILNKFFNINNPITFEMFSYSFLYLLKLKFLF